MATTLELYSKNLYRRYPLTNCQKQVLQYVLCFYKYSHAINGLPFTYFGLLHLLSDTASFICKVIVDRSQSNYPHYLPLYF